jgi:aromatic ring-cleaving dioxygenase
MALPVAHRKQYIFNKIQARFCCPERQAFADTTEPRRCLGLWVIVARILNQPREGLNVLLHPETGDDPADHTIHAAWLGEKLPLRMEAFADAMNHR